jgi:hypothetical protein
MENFSHSTASVTVQEMRTPGQPTQRHPNDVDFEVKYPDGYDGPKHLPEGVTVVSKETAEDFIKRGIGQIATPSKVEDSTVESTATVPEPEKNSDKPYSKMNKTELQEALTIKGIDYDPELKNKEMIALLEDHDKKVVDEQE